MVQGKLYYSLLIHLNVSLQLMSTSAAERSASLSWREPRMMSVFGQVNTGEEVTDNSRRRHVTGEGHNGDIGTTVGQTASNRQMGECSLAVVLCGSDCI